MRLPLGTRLLVALQAEGRVVVFRGGRFEDVYLDTECAYDDSYFDIYGLRNRRFEIPPRVDITLSMKGVTGLVQEVHDVWDGWGPDQPATGPAGALLPPMRALPQRPE